MSSKSLIFFSILFLVTNGQLAGAAGSKAAGPKIVGDHLSGDRFYERAYLPVQSRLTRPVKLIWQTISSSGRGTSMSTWTESYSTSALLRLSDGDQWRLDIGRETIPTSVMFNKGATEGLLLMDVRDLLKSIASELLFKNFSFEHLSSDAEYSEGDQSTAVALSMSRSLNRHMEIIFRSPEDELFLIKAAIYLPSE